MLNELEKERLINEKLIEENIKLNRLVKIQDKLIKNYDLRNKEYQKSIINKTIRLNRCLQKINKNKETEETEEEEI